MKRELRNNLVYLEDIKISFERIISYTNNLSKDEFKSNQLIIDAVIRNFEIVGEASKNIDSNIKDKFENVPWKEMYYLRNILSHDYFGIDLDIVWEIIENNIKSDLNSIKNIIIEIKNSSK